MSPTKLLLEQIVVVFAIVVFGIWFATQWSAVRLGYQPELGRPWFYLFDIAIYRPWSIFPWWYHFDAYAPRIFSEAGAIAGASGFVGCGAAIVGSLWRARQGRLLTTYGSARWATDGEIARAGLYGDAGFFLGRLHGRYLRHNGPEHIMAFAPTRSGKGVGLVVPTLLGWTGSAGRRCSEHLDLAPTPANIKAAERLMVRVHHEIEYDLFDYARTFPNSEMARAEAEERAEAEQQARSEREAQTIYFCDFADRWLASLTVEKSTYDCYLGAIEGVWKPHFRDRPIGSIRPSEIKAVIAELVKRVTGKTVNNSLIPLRGVFAAAVDDEIIERAPTVNIKSLKHQSPKPDPFRADEMEAIIASLHDRYDPQIGHWYEFAFGTGMRPSEQIVVRWGDVDWNGETIRVERARVRAVVKSTKSGTIRDVDLTQRMLAVLDRQRSFSFMKGADAPIFENPSSRLPWPDVQDQRKLYFHPTLLRLGLRKRDAYQTRHTFATLALMAGVNPAYIARQLGHANTAMLFKHYSK